MSQSNPQPNTQKEPKDNQPDPPTIASKIVASILTILGFIGILFSAYGLIHKPWVRVVTILCSPAIFIVIYFTWRSRLALIACSIAAIICVVFVLVLPRPDAPDVIIPAMNSDQPKAETKPAPKKNETDKERALGSFGLNVFVLKMNSGSRCDFQIVYPEDDRDSSDLALNILRASSMVGWNLLGDKRLPSSRMTQEIILETWVTPPPCKDQLEDALSTLKLATRWEKDLSLSKDALRLTIGPHPFGE